MSGRPCNFEELYWRIRRELEPELAEKVIAIIGEHRPEGMSVGVLMRAARRRARERGWR